jgi:hypothetical protein
LQSLEGSSFLSPQNPPGFGPWGFNSPSRHQNVPLCIFSSGISPAPPLSKIVLDGRLFHTLCQLGNPVEGERDSVVKANTIPV